MLNKTDPPEIELICIIVNFGFGSKVIKAAKQYGCPGGTIAFGKGTINNHFLDFIGLSDIRKEIVVIIAEKTAADLALLELNRIFEFFKPHHGIAFTTSISGIAGTKAIACSSLQTERGERNAMYRVITTIVDKGKAEDVIHAAYQAGSKGGTIINARGSGIHETSKLFSMEIEPEKEIVMILSETELTSAIVHSIRQNLKIDEPGNGIIYIQDVNKTYGIYQ
ncbi:MAG: P-II family nitrogen regulator [Oscillospiraceae bacterium]|nr:P-II family nitrogen regulator [Oscillospiraceae bacterium]